MNIRYAESKDITKIYNIEKRVFVNSWSKDSILQELKREKNSINLVCEINNNLVGPDHASSLNPLDFEIMVNNIIRFYSVLLFSTPHSSFFKKISPISQLYL